MTDGAEDEGSTLEIDGAVEAMAGLRAAASETADAVDAAFARAGSSLARSMARAAADGEVSLSELARALIGTLNAAFGAGRSGGSDAGVGLLDGLIGGVLGALAPLLGGVLGGVSSKSETSVARSSAAPTRPTPVGLDPPPLTGRERLSVDWTGLARAMERPAAPAMASTGAPWRSEIRGAETAPAPQAAAPVVVNVSVAGGAETLLRSEAQIAQTLARAASLGARRL